MYELVLSSKLPQAQDFKAWVTNEVLPSIRKHGAYITPDKLDEVEANPEIVESLLRQLKEQQAATAPKVAFYSAVLERDALTTSHIALAYNMNAMELNQLLEHCGLQYKVEDKWVLSAKHKGKGYRFSSCRLVNGKKLMYDSKKWSQLGFEYIRRLLAHRGIYPVTHITGI
ncbi:MAG: phage antirepressor KilAC domain-containing protein [Defluviitaleaceae bacterium]|nr:phage antirepressor KilAC domain-containing protein [Defluviitaleaceae bacterium]